MDFSIEQCDHIYQLPPASVSDAIKATNQVYGGLGFSGERVIFVNGTPLPLSLPLSLSLCLSTSLPLYLSVNDVRRVHA